MPSGRCPVPLEEVTGPELVSGARGGFPEEVELESAFDGSVEARDVKDQGHTAFQGEGGPCLVMGWL